MIRIPGGDFLMGSNGGEAYPADGEGPVRIVEVAEFLIDATCVSNAQFAEFVSETGYVTDAERFGWSFVFDGFVEKSAPASIMGRSSGTSWWAGVKGAYWKAPFGPGSSIDEISNHPVVHVSFNDAQTFATWAGKTLPTEAQWEKAARGGSIDSLYPWGDELTPNGNHMFNIWQGEFPVYNSGDDGYTATAPVDAFEPNGYGLYNVSGNVWEWCSDWWSFNWHAHASVQTRTNPRGPSTGTTKVIRGGSYMCHESYCNRYRLSARTSNLPDSSSGHMGFRCVQSTDPKTASEK